MFNGAPARPPCGFDFAANGPQFWAMADSHIFAPDYDVPIDYMRRTRDYYLALGYDNPYRWAHYVDAPFQPLKKPLGESTLALISTAAPYQPDKGDHDTRISHIGYDRLHTTAKDSNTWFPLPLMRRMATEGRFKLAPRFHG